jgi:hypothetical protein
MKGLAPTLDRPEQDVSLAAYEEFLRAKVKLADEQGFPCEPSEVHPALKPHQRDIVVWAVRGGRRAIFAAFGMGKTLIQLEIVRLVLAKLGTGRGLITIPLGTQYEYSPSYNDFGHTDDERHFWAQMDFLTPQLLRVLQPGRNLVVHVKDRIVPSGLTKLGFQVVQPFHADAIYHYQRHGFAYLGMRTIVTDVVRENSQTYRLGWSEQCKDGSRMGVGMPEYLLLFRKPPTDTSNGYADVPEGVA